MKQEDIYYRTGGKITHAGCEILDAGKDTVFVIDHIEFKEQETINGRTENGVWLMHIKRGNKMELPVILNSTNKKRLVKLFPECEGFLARIKNKAVVMTKELTRDPNGGGQTYGLRVSPIPAPAQKPAAPAAPAKKPELTEDKLDAAIAWAKANGKTVEDIKCMYTMSETIENAIKDALNGDEGKTVAPEASR